MSGGDHWQLDITTASARIRSGDLTAAQLIASTLDRIANVEPHLHAFVSVDAEGATRTAAALDSECARSGPRGPLHGIPIAVKDIFDVAGSPTRCGCRAYDDVPPASADCAAVARLRAAGAVVVGKTTTHELAYGVYTPPTANPWHFDHIPGGSSGGSGAAVAAGAALAALGSDTGGSIRIPAALCGVVGIKPTYGRVSRAGVAVLSWSLDHVGPLAGTVDDAAAVLAAIAGPDPRDPTSRDRPLGDLLRPATGGLRGVRLGVPGEVFGDRLEPAVEETFKEAQTALTEAGATLVDVSIPELNSALATEFAIVLPEAAAYHENLLRTRAQLIGKEVRGLLEAGALAPATDYLRAQRARAAIVAAIRQAFEHHHLDAMVAPTLPATAARREQLVYDFDGYEETVTDAYVRTTAPFNLTGQPVVAVPAGMSTAGLPIGVQFAGRPFDEATVLNIARVFEGAVGWRAQHRVPAALGAAVSG